METLEAQGDTVASRARARGRQAGQRRADRAAQPCARSRSAAGVVVLRGVGARDDQRARLGRRSVDHDLRDGRARARRETSAGASRCTRCWRRSAGGRARPSSRSSVADPLALCALALQDEGRTTAAARELARRADGGDDRRAPPGPCEHPRPARARRGRVAARARPGNSFSIVLPAGGLLELDHESDPR